MSTEPRFRLLAQRLAVVALVAAMLLVTHKFSRTVGRTPALAFDDSLAAVSANLAREGRLGYDAIPVNTLALVSQNEHLFNYGPWYFVLGSALDWLFGTSYETHRWLHLLGLLSSLPLAALFFLKKREAAFGTAIYGSGALLSFHYHQWPMARPDIFGTIGVSLALVFAGMALEDSRLRWIFGFGLSVGLAVTSHPIVAALLPWSAAAVLAIWWLAPKGPGFPSLGGRAVAWISGMAVAGLGLLVASGFRPTAIVRLYLLYPRFIQSVGSKIGFFESIDRHLSFIGLQAGRAQALAVLLLVIVCVDLVGFCRRPRVESLMTLLPGGAFASYLLSLGVFRNAHEGYEILVQVLFLWTMTAFILRFGRGLVPFFGVAAPLAALGCLTVYPGRWEVSASDTTPYQQYIDAVRSDIPANAYVQGEAIFGIGRPNWVEMGHAAFMTSAFLPRYRTRLTPDFLVVSEKEWGSACLQTQAIVGPRLLVPGRPQPGPSLGGFFNSIPWLFSDNTFRLLRIVAGRPYGATRVYVRANDEGAAPPRPEVAVWTPGELWQRKILERGTPFSPAGAFGVKIPTSRTVDGHDFVQTAAEHAWEASLEAGSYLIEVVGSAAAEVAGCVVATGAPGINDLGDLLSAAPRFPKGLVTYLVVSHSGGILHVGLLGPGRDEEVSRVTAFKVATPLSADGLRGATEKYPAALLHCVTKPNGTECVVPEL